MAGGAISPEDFQTAVVEVDWAAQIAGPPLYGEWKVAPADHEGDIVEANVGTRPATSQY